MLSDRATSIFFMLHVLMSIPTLTLILALKQCKYIFWKHNLISIMFCQYTGVCIGEGSPVRAAKKDRDFILTFEYSFGITALISTSYHSIGYSDTTAKVCLPDATKQLLQITWTLCQYVINRTRHRFTVCRGFIVSCRTASSVNSITKGFYSLVLSCPV